MGDDTEYVLTGRLDQARRGVVAGAVTDRWCRCAEPVVLSPQYAGRTAICTVCIDGQRPTFPAEILEYEADGEGFRIGEHRWFRGVLSAGPSPTNRVADKTPIPWAEGTGSVPLLKEDQQVDRHARLFRRLLKSQVLPLVSIYVTQAEWKALGEHGQSGLPKGRKGLVLLSAMLEEATPQERVRFLALLPAPVRLIWRMVGGGISRRAKGRLLAGT